jgi:phage N-6-adenine-methyltransferase
VHYIGRRRRTIARHASRFSANAIRLSPIAPLLARREGRAAFDRKTRWSRPLAKTATSAGRPADSDTGAVRNNRPGPDVPVLHRASSLNELVQDARVAEERINRLEQTKKRTAKVLLFENLDQALRIAAAVEHGQSVAAFARQAGIEERRAQRLYHLAAGTDRIRKEVRAGEDLYGDDFEYPSWKRFLRPEPTERGNDGTGLAKTVVDPDQLDAAQTKIADLESANKELEARLQALKGGAPYGLYGRGDPEREAPQWLFDHYDREFDLTLDVAATAQNAKCPRFFTKVENGLVQVWYGNVWLNPPYRNIGPWCRKAWEYARTGKGVVVALLPIWPTASWFREYVIHGHIRLLTTRFSAVGTKTRAPFDFMVVVWTATSQFSNGCLRVTMEDVPNPKDAGK